MNQVSSPRGAALAVYLDLIDRHSISRWVPLRHSGKA